MLSLTSADNNKNGEEFEEDFDLKSVNPVWEIYFISIQKSQYGPM